MFEAINYLLFDKKDGDELDPDILENFDPYMVRRYASFHGGPSMIQYLNDNLNQFDGVLEHEDLFNFYKLLIPKTKKKWIKYVKKEQSKTVDDYRPREFFSKREKKIYDELLLIDNECK